MIKNIVFIQYLLFNNEVNELLSLTVNYTIRKQIIIDYYLQHFT